MLNAEAKLALKENLQAAHIAKAEIYASMVGLGPGVLESCIKSGEFWEGFRQDVKNLDAALVQIGKLLSINPFPLRSE